MSVITSCIFIIKVTALHQSTLYSVLAEDKPITFPPEEEISDYDEGESKRKKRDTENNNENTETEEEEENTEPNVRFTITKELFGEIDKSKKKRHFHNKLFSFNNSHI